MQARFRTSSDGLVLVFAMLWAAAMAAPWDAGQALGRLFIAETREIPLDLQAAPKPARTDLDLPPEAVVRRFAPIVERAARAHGVDEALVHAVIFAESSYDPRAVSPAGATGLMQLMPATAQQYGVRDLFDPAQNVSGGVRFLRDLLARFDGNIELALAAYNAGANAVIRAGNRVPPYPATAAYVPKVIDYYRHFQAVEG